MPRKPLILSENLPYHVTARAHNKEPFPLPIKRVWELANYSFKEANEIHQINLISFVLMNNHYHMLLYTPNRNLDRFMYEFNKRLALKIQSESGVINQIFGGRYKGCLIQSQQYLSNCYRYVYQNPVRAGLVNRAEEYSYGTLQCSMGRSRFAIPIHDKFGFKDGYGLSWLNENIRDHELDSLKKSLSRSVLVKL
ncbi:MAG: transposase [Bacteriovorax sp.]